MALLLGGIFTLTSEEWIGSLLVIFAIAVWLCWYYGVFKVEIER